MDTLSVQDYLAALKENRLLGRRCNECGFITAPPRLACRRCSAINSETIELQGKGRIVTFTSVYVAGRQRQGQTPFLVIMVEMDEGPWLMGNLLGVDAATASLDLIGRRVRMDNARARDLYAGNEPADGPAPLFVIDQA